MLIITKTEWETLKLYELPNKYYNALVRMLDVRTGNGGFAKRVIRKHWDKTLKEFDNNSFLSVTEVFEVMA